MSGIIHMETEEVRSVAQKLDQTSFNIYQQVADLGKTLNGLDWQSPSRDSFVSDFAELRRKFQVCTEQGATLGLRMQREVEEWIAVDNAEANSPTLDTRSAIMLPNDGIPPIPFPGQRYVDQKFDWWEAVNGVADGIPLEELFPGVFLLGIYTDIHGGDSWDKALMSEITEKLAKKALLLIPPPVGEAAIVSVEVFEASLAVLHAISILFELVGKHSEAMMLQNSLETLDLSEKLGDGAYDVSGWLVNTYQQAQKSMCDLVFSNNVIYGNDCIPLVL